MLEVKIKNRIKILCVVQKELAEKPKYIHTYIYEARLFIIYIDEAIRHLLLLRHADCDGRHYCCTTHPTEKCDVESRYNWRKIEAAMRKRFRECSWHFITPHAVDATT